MATKSASGMDLVVRPARAEASLWRRFRIEEQGDCREVLFNRYVHLARSIAMRQYRLRPAGRYDRSEFEQLAYEGLLQAIDRFNPLRSVPFTAFARRRIAGSIADGLSRLTENHAQANHRSRVEHERLRSLTAAEPQGAEDALSSLRDLAVGLALGLMLEGTSLIGSNGGADCRPNPYETLEWRQMQVRLVHELSRLPEQEAVIIRQHYDNGLRFSQIAELLGVTRGRISQLHRSALTRLRGRLGG